MDTTALITKTKHPYGSEMVGIKIGEQTRTWFRHAMGTWIPTTEAAVAELLGQPQKIAGGVVTVHGRGQSR